MREELPPYQPEAPSPELPTTPAADKPKGRRGRPPGSKNKPQTAEQLLSDEAARELLNTPLAEGTSAAEALDRINELYMVGREDEDLGEKTASAPAFRDFTLSEIAAAAKATGAEVTIHFSGKVA